MERNIKFFFAALACGAIILLAACGNAPTPTPDILRETSAPTRRPVIIPTTPPGWTPYSRSTYQIALPDAWQEVKLSEQNLKDAIASAQENNPPLAEQLRTLLESGQYKSLAFYAVEKSNAPVLKNVSIARLALQGTNDLEAFAKSYADALPNVARGSRVIEVQAPLQINGTNAAAFQYDVSLVNTEGVLTTLRGVQYLYVLDSGDAYLVTVMGDANDAEKFLPLARQIATSFVGVTP